MRTDIWELIDDWWKNAAVMCSSTDHFRPLLRSSLPAGGRPSSAQRGAAADGPRRPHRLPAGPVPSRRELHGPSAGPVRGGRLRAPGGGQQSLRRQRLRVTQRLPAHTGNEEHGTTESEPLGASHGAFSRSQIICRMTWLYPSWVYLPPRHPRCRQWRNLTAFNQETQIVC